MLCSDAVRLSGCRPVAETSIARGTTGRTNVKPQTFKTAANAALHLGEDQLGIFDYLGPWAIACSNRLMTNVDVGLINRPPPLQGQQGQQGLRFEVLRRTSP